MPVNITKKYAGNSKLHTHPSITAHYGYLIILLSITITPIDTGIIETDLGKKNLFAKVREDYLITFTESMNKTCKIRKETCGSRGWVSCFTDYNLRLKNGKLQYLMIP